MVTVNSSFSSAVGWHQNVKMLLNVEKNEPGRWHHLEEGEMLQLFSLLLRLVLFPSVLFKGLSSELRESFIVLSQMTLIPRSINHTVERVRVGTSSDDMCWTSWSSHKTAERETCLDLRINNRRHSESGWRRTRSQDGGGLWESSITQK